ncbi:MAG TPA: ABC transporter permease subunit, partial [Nitrolancea sp.]|nr:ABC transporter permease subunit [Nitrolancea sp.]
MFRSIFTKTLREQRWAVLIWSLLIVVIMIVGYQAYNQINPAEIVTLVQNPAFKFLADPVAVGTPSGLVTFRYGYFFSLVLSIFAVLIGGRMLRGEETRGALDLILARPRSRRDVLLEKVGASVISLLILGLAYGVGAMLGEAALGVPVTVAGGFLAGLNLSLLLFFYAMLALLVSNYTRSAGAAAGIAGGLYGIFFVLDGTGRIYPSLKWLRRLSPDYYYDLSKPLITSYGTNLAAMLFLLLLGLILLAGSLALFARRDVGAVATLPLVGGRIGRQAKVLAPEAEIDRTARDLWLRSVLAHTLRVASP